jgi:hypothetical protein
MTVSDEDLQIIKDLAAEFRWDVQITKSAASPWVASYALITARPRRWRKITLESFRNALSLLGYDLIDRGSAWEILRSDAPSPDIEPIIIYHTAINKPPWTTLTPKP